MKVTVIHQSGLDAFFGEMASWGQRFDDGVLDDEMISRRTLLLERLGRFGKDGDDFRKHDFCVGPHPMEIKHRRYFVVGVITKRFFKSDFVPVLTDFVQSERDDYLIEVGSCTNWMPYFHMTLTRSEAKVFSEDPKAVERMVRALQPESRAEDVGFVSKLAVKLRGKAS